MKPNGQPGRSLRPTAALSIDLEEYFHVWALEPAISRDDWDRWPSRVEHSTRRILDMLDMAGEAKATFFVLGVVAAAHHGLLREIAARGHEVASHGWNHRQLSNLTPEGFRADVRQAKAAIEDAAGTAVRGYRAPNFSIDERTPWAHPILEDTGHVYSSSVAPVVHDHYGMPGAPPHPYRPKGTRLLVEIPIATVEIAGRRWPCGGGWFRLAPYPLSRAALRRIALRADRAPVFYFHPWEIDPDQPYVAGVSWRSRFRHYVGLETMEAKLSRLLADFAWCRVDDALETVAYSEHASAPDRGRFFETAGGTR